MRASLQLMKSCQVRLGMRGTRPSSNGAPVRRHSVAYREWDLMTTGNGEA